jgi:hypothetical protein
MCGAVRDELPMWLLLGSIYPVSGDILTRLMEPAEAATGFSGQNNR